MSLLRVERRDIVASGSPTYNPFNNPAVPLQSVGFDNVFGGNKTDAGESVTPDTAVGVATFYRCLFLLSSVVASCQLEEFRRKDHEQIPNPLFDPGNDVMTYTPFELWQLVMVYRLVWGDSFTFKKRDGYDRVIDLKPLYPELVKVDMLDGHKVFLVKKIDDQGQIDSVSEPQVFTDWEIMHVPGLGYNGLQGLSVVNLMAQSLGTAMAADKLAARFYSRGSQLGGILKVKAPLRSQSQAEGIKARWHATHGGTAHAGEIALLDAETDFQTVTIPPDQLQFLESRRWQTTEIARWFGVPPHLVGDVEKSTSWGTGIEQQNLGLNNYTLSGHTNPIEQRATRELLVRGHYAQFNLDNLMRGSTQERFQALMTATGGPWMTRNEARASENMKPLKTDAEYDELLPPQGIGPVSGASGASGGSNNKAPKGSNG